MFLICFIIWLVILRLASALNLSIKLRSCLPDCIFCNVPTISVDYSSSIIFSQLPYIVLELNDVYTFFRKPLPELSFFYSLNLSVIVPVPEIVLKSVPVTVLVKLMFFVPMLLSVEDFLPHEYSNF